MNFITIACIYGAMAIMAGALRYLFNNTVKAEVVEFGPK